ncbi:MAG: leucine-rich repeat domain-containing protein, partial [Prevotella sp.]|nr:leucine-rich repeat domain-containing protein [Prevotella sp.]
MKLKIIRSLLTIVCLLSSLSISAYDFEVDGFYYDVVSLSERTCRLVGYPSTLDDVVIPAHVSYAGETLTVVDISCDFGPGLKEISIPNTVTLLRGGFDACKNLERVRIEDGEKTLGLASGEYYGLFYYCPINSLYIGRNLSYDTSRDRILPFYDCRTLTSVIIGNSVTSIGPWAFFGCSGLTSVIIGNSVTSIGPWAFFGCSGLT